MINKYFLLRHLHIALFATLMYGIMPSTASANGEIAESVTVYVDAPFAGKRKKSARKITESHQKHREMGYEFSDLEVYVENGDLKGFFVTYTKR